MQKSNFHSFGTADEEPSIKIFRCSYDIFIKIKAIFISLSCYRDLGDGQFAICIPTYLSETDDIEEQANEVQYLLHSGEEQLHQLAGISHSHVKGLEHYFDLLAFRLDDKIQ